MNPRTWSYYIRSSLSSIRENGLMSFASASTVAISLLVLAVFLVLALNLQHMGQVLDAQVQVVAYLKSDFSESGEAALMAQVEAIPGVAQATFISKGQALAELKKQFGDQQDLLASVAADNPLPDTIEVQVKSPGDIAAVAKALGKNPSVQQADYKQAVVQRLFAFTRALRIVGGFLVAGLALATIVLIANTTRIAVYARREEIGIMKLVGATDGFIRWPFLLEGAVLGLVGATVATAATWWGYSWLVQKVALVLPFVPVLPRQPLLLQTGEVLLLLGLLLGSIGSGWSVRRFLRV